MVLRLKVFSLRLLALSSSGVTPRMSHTSFFVYGSGCRHFLASSRQSSNVRFSFSCKSLKIFTSRQFTPFSLAST